MKEHNCLQDANEANARLADRVSGLEHMYSALQKDKEAVDDRTQRYRAQRDAERAANEQIKGKLAKATAQLKDLTGKYDALQLQMNNITARVAGGPGASSAGESRSPPSSFGSMSTRRG